MGVRAALVLGLISVGCYHPDIKNKGFSCSVDRPQCPDGFSCVAGFCVTNDSYTGPDEPDLALAPDLAPAAPSCAASGDYCRRDSDCCGRYCVYRTNSCR
jgi:hypothetical protein